MHNTLPSASLDSASANSASTAEMLPAALLAELRTILPSARVLDRYIDRVAYASDASLYHLIPKVVVQPETIAHVQALCQFSSRSGIPLTFRAAGTSLSGQAVTDGILVDLAKRWNKIAVEDNAKSVRLQPGVIGQTANMVLARHHAKIGPDPASINACMIGGILANNASGMCCGVSQNAYHTLRSMTFVLPDGDVFNTADKDADQQFKARQPELSAGLLELRARVLADTALTERIRGKYRQKNTTGYSLNAFIDFDRSIDIMQHLLIGSEGTLAFIAEAVLETVPALPLKYTGLLMFNSIRAAADSIVPLRDSGAAALEIMDRASLRSVEDASGVPAYVKGLTEHAAGLLVEYQAADQASLEQCIAKAEQVLAGLELAVAPDFTLDAERQAAFWHVRKGMFPSVGSVRARGSTVIIEDVVFPVERLADGIAELQALFIKHDYTNAIIFGHAKDGNLHFVITPEFGSDQAIAQYSAFMKDMVEVVVGKFDGALKAEHGTGRNIAPFVEAEWGGAAYAVMKELKELVDPHAILNPGVIINSDPDCFIKHIKSMPEVEPEVDKCTECGFCEPKCPSRTLTLTPRQRIVVRREMARLAGGSGKALAEIERAYQYDGIQTCAADGLCATACPVGIDTGSLMKRFRARKLTRLAEWVSLQIAQHFAIVERLARGGLRAGHAVSAVVGRTTLGNLGQLFEKLTGVRILKWAPIMPQAAAGVLPKTSAAGATAVYFPSCVTRTMGSLAGERKATADALLSIAAKAGERLWIPDGAAGQGVAGHCCGTAFASKGCEAAAKLVFNRLIEQLYVWSEQGKLPIVVDTSPCSYGLLTPKALLDPALAVKYRSLKIYDVVEYVGTVLAPKLELKPIRKHVVLHPVCSVQKMNLAGNLKKLAERCSEKVTIPISAGCCGFAGDRGLIIPELTKAALSAETCEVQAEEFDGYYSSSRTCELGLTQVTGHTYQSIVHLVDEASGG